MKKLYLLMMICLLTIAYAAADTCMDTLDAGQECEMLTPDITCTTYNYTIYNSTTSIQNGTLINVENGIYKFDFNLSIGDYIVKICDGSTREIKVVEPEEDTMQGIWILLSMIGLLSFAGYVFKDKGTAPLVGMLTLLLGLTILRLDDTMLGLTEISQMGLGVSVTMIGFYLVIWFGVRKFFKPKDQEETEILVQREYK